MMHCVFFFFKLHKEHLYICTINKTGTSSTLVPGVFVLLDFFSPVFESFNLTVIDKQLKLPLLPGF